MGLFKWAVVAAVGVALLPSDKEQQEMLYNRAALAAEWTVTFCDRNGETCKQATAFWDQFKKKAQFAATLAYDTISEQMAGGAQDGKVAPAAYRPHLDGGTLEPRDLEPAWGGKGASKVPVKRAGRLSTGTGI